MTTFHKVTNGAMGQVATALGGEATDLTLVLGTGEGTLFPASGAFYLRITDTYDASGLPLAYEYVEVASRVTDTLTIATRGALGSSRTSHGVGANVDLCVVAELFTELQGAVTTLEAGTVPVLAVGGGYGSTGASIDASGNIQTNGNVTVDGTLAVGGGYGATGFDVAATGNVRTNGTLTVDGASTLTGVVTASNASNAITIGTSCNMASPPLIGETAPNGVYATRCRIKPVTGQSGSAFEAAWYWDGSNARATLTDFIAGTFEWCGPSFKGAGRALRILTAAAYANTGDVVTFNTTWINTNGVWEFPNNIAVNGGSITSTASTVNVLTAATTMNLGTGASTALNVGHASAAATFNGGVNVASGKVYKVNGTKVVGAQGAAVADVSATSSAVTDNTEGAASGSHTLVLVGSLYSQSAVADNFATLAAEYNLLRTEVESLKSQLNALLARMRTHGLIAT